MNAAAEAKIRIASARELLEEHGYVVARMAEPGSQEVAFAMGDEYVAFRLVDGETAWIRPKEFCERIGISRHTLTRKLKLETCPQPRVQRGPMGRLVYLQPTKELINYLRMFKTSS